MVEQPVSLVPGAVKHVQNLRPGWFEPLVNEIKKIWVYLVIGLVFLIMLYSYRRIGHQESEILRLRAELRNSVAARMNLEKSLATANKEAMVWESKYKETKSMLEKERAMVRMSAMSGVDAQETPQSGPQVQKHDQSAIESRPKVSEEGPEKEESEETTSDGTAHSDDLHVQFGPSPLLSHLSDEQLNFQPIFDAKSIDVLAHLNNLVPTRRAPRDEFAPSPTDEESPQALNTLSASQASSTNGSESDLGIRASKQELEAVRAAIRTEIAHAYFGYERYAAGFDELLPVTRTGSNTYTMGLTIVDSLDTLLIAGLEPQACRALDWIYDHLTFDIPRPKGLNVFEITIRVLGGLLSSHALLLEAHHHAQVILSSPERPTSQDQSAPRVNLQCDGYSKYPWDAEDAALMLLRKARDLAEEIKFIFDSTPTGAPLSLVDLPGHASAEEGASQESSLSKDSLDLATRKRNYAPKWLRGATIVSEAGTMQLEWLFLSHLTGNPEYGDRAMRVMRNLFIPIYRDGRKLLPRYLNPNTGAEVDSLYTWAAGVDSTYEYFYKQYLFLESQLTWAHARLENEKDLSELRNLAPSADLAAPLLNLYRTTFGETVNELLLPSYPSGLAWIAEKSYRTLVGKMHHLACFAPGLFAMSAQKWNWTRNDDKFVVEAVRSRVSPRAEITAQTTMDIAEALTRTCYELYARTPTGLAPETSVFGLGEMSRSGPSPTSADFRQRRREQMKNASVDAILHEMNEAKDPNYFQRTITFERKQSATTKQKGRGGQEQEYRFGRKIPKPLPRTSPERVQPLFPVLPGSVAARTVNLGHPKIDDFSVDPRAPHNALRPEAMESIYILYRLTRNEKYRLWAWDLFKSFVRYCRIPGGGYAGLKDVRDFSIDATSTEISDELFTKPSPSKGKPASGKSSKRRLVLWRNWKDHMDTFWIAETLKYLYLIFLDEDDPASRIVQHDVPLDKWLYTTEAHVFPLPHAFPHIATISRELLRRWDMHHAPNADSSVRSPLERGI